MDITFDMLDFVFLGKKLIFQNENSLNFERILVKFVDLSTGELFSYNSYGKRIKEVNPLDASFPTGKFPVQLSILNFGKIKVISFARVLFAKKPATRWELILPKGEDSSIVKQKASHRKKSKSSSLFLDESFSVYLAGDDPIDKSDYIYLDDEAPYPIYYSESAEYYKGQEWIQSPIVKSSEFLVKIIPNKYYPNYIGYDENGRICRLVTDLGVVDWRTAGTEMSKSVYEELKNCNHKDYYYNRGDWFTMTNRLPEDDSDFFFVYFDENYAEMEERDREE